MKTRRHPLTHGWARRTLARLELLGAAAVATSLAMAAEPPPADRCSARPVDAAASAPVRLETLRYRCLTLRDGQEMLVGEAGPPDRPVVLLLHGLGGSAHRDWAPVIPALAAQFRVLAVDLPGFGESPAAPRGYAFATLGEALQGVLEQLAPGRRAHVVGHSLGAAIGLHFAHAHPERVDRLVLADAAGILLKSVYMRHFATPRSPRVGFEPVDRLLRGVYERYGDFRRGMFDRLEEGFDFSRWLARHPEIRVALLGRHVQLDAALGLVEHDFTAAIRDTRAPTTVIWGAEDAVAPPRTGRLLAGRMPDARLQVMEDVGHTPMLDSPDAFDRLLLAALAAPLGPRAAGPGSGPSQGDAKCDGRAQARFSGVYDSLVLDQCPGAVVTDARLRRLELRSSSVTIENTVVDSGDVALSADASEVRATNVTLRGRVAIRAAQSRLDLAGVSLWARGRGVEISAPSRIDFSVSEWHGTDHDGDAHFTWSQVGGR